ncbi:winged helix-turn-helix transcriptional regulator [Niveispirillum sp. KHB5.9]|uniref:winged helix-turn-helix transcriptional regulator n=1 Tax=Niveispirillum sp. KHB5.9 TaxID=3400269 RepID=UPI003A84F71B
MALKIRKNPIAIPPPYCPVSEFMNLLSGAWTTHVLWHLQATPRRFGELRVDIPQISAKTLTVRLRMLEEHGLVSRTVMPTSPPSAEYALTEPGRELLPVLNAIAQVGMKLKLNRQGDHVCPQTGVPDIGRAV